MIKSIHLQNFKSIKRHQFPLRNLNLMLGLNGMGKSTFIQSLLLLKQSGNLSNGELSLNGPLVEIGKGSDAFYQYSKSDKIILDICFTDESQTKFEFAYESEVDFLRAKQADTLNRFFFQQAIFLDGRFQYLGASRIDPAVIHNKNYTSVVKFRNLGERGQFTAHFLHVYGSNDVAFLNLRHSRSTTPLLMEQVNHWMGEISPGVKFNTTEIPNSGNILLDMQFQQPNFGFTGRFRPTNVGFGISYALPVVTALLASQEGDIIIIENPESHIHPRGQAELGKLIAKVAMNDVQVFVETHSDHILNGIRVAARENDITANRIMLFYFEKEIQENEQYSKITNIEIDKAGELSSYPKNLLDEWGNQLVKLV